MPSDARQDEVRSPRRGNQRVRRGGEARRGISEANTVRGHHGKAPPATLFERIGGLTVVDTAVDLLHRRGDPDLSPFRAGVDLARLPGLQVEFIAKTRRFSDLSSGDIGVDGRAGAGIRDRRPEPFRQTDR